MFEVLQLLEKRVFDFSKLQVGGTQTLTIAERIEVTKFALATVQLRVHSSDVSGGTVTFDLHGEGRTGLDPGIQFVTSSPLFPSIAVESGAPRYSTYGGGIPGEFVQLKVSATKTSASPLVVTASVDLVVEEASPIDPVTIFGTTLLGWWDANTGLSVSGGSVDSWTDRRNGFVLSQTGGNRPTYNATGWNGNQPTVTLALASAQYLINTSTAALIDAVDANDAPWAMFGAVRIASIHDGSIGAWKNAGNPRNVLRTTDSSGGRIGVQRNDGVTNTTNQTTGSTGTTRHFVAGICRGTTVDVWLDGVKDVDGAASDVGATDADMFLVGTMDGDISELVVVRGAVTDQQVTALRDYLRSKWGGLP